MSPNQTPNPARIRAQHLRCVTLHEVCHAFVELHRSAGIRITLKLNPFYPIQPHSKSWDGRVEAMVTNEETYRDSVYGWAGIMGEAIEQDSANAVVIVLEKYQNERETVSASDLERIESVVASIRPKAAVTAYEALIGSWGEIKDIQNRAIKFIEGNGLESLTFGWMKNEGWVGLEADK